jgi:hypothetical protein
MSCQWVSNGYVVPEGSDLHDGRGHRLGLEIEVDAVADIRCGRILYCHLHSVYLCTIWRRFLTSCAYYLQCSSDQTHSSIRVEDMRSGLT